MKNFKPTRYRLQTVATGREFEDDGWTLDDPEYDGHSLIRAIFEQKQLKPREDRLGLYKFADWLPINKILEGSSAPITYKSKGLGEALGLENLYITFSGYFPEIGATMTGCSFKETEAYSVCARMDSDEKRVMVVASAGNTARAFAKVCSDNNIPLLLSVPEDNLDALWFEEPLNDCVKLISPVFGGDYFDAIHLSNIVLNSPRFFAEGGAKNIARRDGMSTTVLSAVNHIGQIPDYYYQAVGSGTGAIAAWEANMRFIEDGRYGDKKMKLVVSQNRPFAPMYNSWKAGQRELLPYDEEQARIDAETIAAKVLSNRKPPFSIAGGLYDALIDTGGTMDAITNRELSAAAQLFEELEGIDIYSASGVATSSLIKATKRGDIKSDEIVMLNITGGGERRFKDDLKERTGRKAWYLKPSLLFPLDPNPEEVLEQVEKLF